jgi:hypothetical protein
VDYRKDGQIMTIAEIPRDQFFRDAGMRIRQKVAAQIGLQGLRTNDRGNVMEIPITGIKGCHYEIGFHRDCHEIALHFQGTADNNASRLAGFLPHIDHLNASLGYPLKPDQHEGQGRKRLWIKLPLNPCTQALLEEYSDLTARLIILTFPILRSVLEKETQTVTR